MNVSSILVKALVRHCEMVTNELNSHAVSRRKYVVVADHTATTRKCIGMYETLPWPRVRLSLYTTNDTCREDLGLDCWCTAVRWGSSSSSDASSGDGSSSSSSSSRTISCSTWWLNNSVLLQCKLATLCFKSHIMRQPDYLAVTFNQYYEPSRFLRSSTQHLLSVPFCNTALGNHRFSVAALLVWNSLPLDLRTVNSLPAFKNNLKTFLFRRDFK